MKRLTRRLLRLDDATRARLLQWLTRLTVLVWAATFVIAPESWLGRAALVAMLLLAARSLMSLGRDSVARAAKITAGRGPVAASKTTTLPPTTKLVVKGLPGSMGDDGLLPVSEIRPHELVYRAPVLGVQVVGWSVDLGGARLSWSLKPVMLQAGDAYRLPRQVVLRGF